MLADNNEMVIFTFDDVQASTKVDGSLTVRLSTPELTPTKIAQIFGLRKKSGFAAMKGIQITPEELKGMSETPIDLDMPEGKSPSERLRNVLFAVFKHEDPVATDFTEFYRITMEKVISHYKKRLPPRE